MVKYMWIYEFKKKGFMDAITKFTSVGQELKELYCCIVAFLGFLFRPKPLAPPMFKISQLMSSLCSKSVNL